jgi:hypothetical protein
MAKRADKATSYSPRSALTPPRSPAPIKATRPDFPVRAGQFFMALFRPVAVLARPAERLRVNLPVNVRFTNSVSVPGQGRCARPSILALPERDAAATI